MPEFLAGHMEAAEDRGFKGRVVGTFILYVPRGVLVVKNPPADAGLKPGPGRSPGGGNGNLMEFQLSYFKS